MHSATPYFTLLVLWPKSKNNTYFEVNLVCVIMYLYRLLAVVRTCVHALCVCVCVCVCVYVFVYVFVCVVCMSCICVYIYVAGICGNQSFSEMPRQLRNFRFCLGICGNSRHFRKCQGNWRNLTKKINIYRYVKSLQKYNLAPILSSYLKNGYLSLFPFVCWIVVFMSDHQTILDLSIMTF